MLRGPSFDPGHTDSGISPFPLYSMFLLPFFLSALTPKQILMASCLQKSMKVAWIEPRTSRSQANSAIYPTTSITATLTIPLYYYLNVPTYGTLVLTSMLCWSCIFGKKVLKNGSQLTCWVRNGFSSSDCQIWGPFWSLSFDRPEQKLSRSQESLTCQSTAISLDSCIWVHKYFSSLVGDFLTLALVDTFFTGF